MDINFIKTVIPQFIEAGILTLKLSFLGILISIAIGFIFSIALYYKIPILKNIIKFYIEFSRNTPLILQLFFLYYGLPKIGVLLEGTTCAVIGLSFLGGSYMAETFRSGLEAIPYSQVESGYSIGLNKLQLMIHVIFPQGFAISLPGIGANSIFLIKETSVFSAIAVADLMFVSKDLIGLYYKTSESLLLLVLSYFIILLPLSLLLTYLERRIRYAGFGH